MIPGAMVKKTLNDRVSPGFRMSVTDTDGLSGDGEFTRAGRGERKNQFWPVVHISVLKSMFVVS